MTERFITKVVRDGDDLVFLFPEDFIKKLNLHDGDILKWTVLDDGRIAIELAGSANAIAADTAGGDSTL